MSDDSTFSNSNQHCCNAAGARAMLREIDALLRRRPDLGTLVAQTDELRFASGGNVTYGWSQTLARYKKSYPDQAAMGTLAFRDLVVTELAPRYVIACAVPRPTALAGTVTLTTLT